jgi:hypothetical protein
MTRRARSKVAAFVCLAVGAAAIPSALPTPAEAKSHLWKFKEVFSSADGAIQYIEMDVPDPSGTEEWVTGGQRLESRGHVLVIPNDLPRVNTADRSMLFATPAFTALPGAPAPDFTIPAGFFDPAGDELRYRFVLDVMTLAPGQVPTDGLHALQRSDGSTPVNSPENFAGATATIDGTPAPVGAVWPPLLGIALLGALALHARMQGRTLPANG